MAMTITIYQAMADLADVLTAGGVRAALDTRDLNPPCVLITPPAVTLRFADGSWAADWRVLCVAPSAGTRQALDTISDLVSRMQAALGGLPVSGSPYELAVDGQSDPLPAYQFTWNTRVR
jgi:hypothetical protein